MTCRMPGEVPFMRPGEVPLGKPGEVPFRRPGAVERFLYEAWRGAF